MLIFPPPLSGAGESLTGNTGVGCCTDGGGASPLTVSIVKLSVLCPRPRAAIAARMGLTQQLEQNLDQNQRNTIRSLQNMRG